MEFDQLISKYPFYKSANAGFALWRVSSELLRQTEVSYQKLHALFFILNGSITIRLDGREMTLENDSFIDIFGRESVTLLRASDDVECYNLILCEGLLTDLFKNKPPLPLSYILNDRNKPISICEPVHHAQLLRRLQTVEEIVEDNGHLFRYEMLYNALTMLYLEVANVYVSQNGESKPVDSDRKKYLFMRFAKLCGKYITTHHTVNFYARQLCITPQYLSRVVKEVTQMTVFEFLQRHLLGECLRLLTDGSKTILQISEELNFSDQATFAKYFKRCTGLSPTDYRLKNSRN